MRAALLALLAAGTTAIVVATSGKSADVRRIAVPAVSAWHGLVGSRPAVALGSRVIVVLRTPSLAQRRGTATPTQAATAQRLLIARLALHGVSIRREYTFTRVLDGFSTLLDPSAFPVVEADKDVAGIYPVRVAYPASIATQVLSRPGYGRANVHASGLDGRGVTIALLDTGVDPTVPYLHGRVLPGIDVVGGAMSESERHGTEMAGLLVGSGGPAGLAGVAPGASVLPIRVAGRQPDGLGGSAIYARSDQIVAGLDRVAGAARIALIALAEPFAGFDDSPEAQAVAGATALGTLVVAPSGNDGARPSSYGDIAGPGGSPDALTVGAVDSRVRVDATRILIRAGLRTMLDGSVAIAGAVTPQRQLDLQIARTGAALVRAGASPALAAERAVNAGARAVLLYGLHASLPAGGLGLDESAGVPIVSIPNEVAHAVEGRAATVALGKVESVPNAVRGTVASFSSAGLASDGRIKPELVAPGVGLATSDRGASRFVTVNGSSAAAAVVAGAAALIVQARPTLSARALKSVLVGTSRALVRTPVAAQGAGLLHVGKAVAAELAASPAALALERVTGPVWSAESTFTLTNLSTRALMVSLHAVSQQEGAAQIGLRIRPSRAALRAGQSIVVHVHATLASTLLGSAQTDGAIVARVASGVPTSIPWSVSFALATPSLIGNATLSEKEFAASDQAPALLSVDAGRVLVDAGYLELRPVSRLDIAVARADGTPIGLLVRVRDLLPGRYAFGITGRGPKGDVLAPGKYLLTVSAYPVGGGLPSTTQLPFSLR